MALAIPIISTFDGGGVSKAINEFKNLEGAGKKAQFAIKKAAVPAAAALAGLAVVLADATKAAMDDDAAQQELARQLRVTTGANNSQIASVEEWISAQGRVLGITDDELRPALAGLVRATSSVSEAQKLATAAMDLAAQKNVSLSTASKVLEKAYGGNLTALAKLAPEYRQMIKDGASFEDVMYAIGQATGGAASTAAETAQGQFKRLGVALDETKESIGAALLPAVEAVLPYLQKFATWAQDNPTTFMIIAGALAAIAASIVAINIAMALNPIGLIVIGVIALIAGLAIAYKKFEGFRNIVDGVFGGIKWWITNIVIPQFNLMLTVFKTIFNGIASVWNNTIGKFSFTVPSWVPGIGGKGFAMPDIPMLANGGIVTGGATLAMIGEKGPEAVIPLDRMGEFGMGGGNNVYLTVNALDPQTAAQSVVKALQSYNRTNGAIPVNVRTL